MSRRRLTSGITLAVALSLAGLLSLGAWSGGTGTAAKADRPPAPPRPSVAPRPPRPSFAIARLRPGKRVALRSEPGGRFVRSLGPTSEFGSPLALGVVRRRGSWLGILTPELGNGVVGWIRLDPAAMQLFWTRYSLHADLSRRRLELRYGDRRVAGFPVTIGGPGSPTPTGRFAVTDAVVFRDSPDYGCCAIALSAHQPSLPPGWLGGDRIAIHATLGAVGEAVSHGCLRATNGALRFLFRHLPLGAPVFIHE